MAIMRELSHRGTAYVQALISVAFIGSYFGILYLFMQGKVHVPLDYKDAFITLLGVLTAGVGVILSYWFQRQRISQEPAQ